MHNRFVRLVNELVRGCITRTSFQPWEVEILIDLESHNMKPRQRMEILRRYQKAMEKQIEEGSGPPITLTEFLQVSTTRRPRSDQEPDSTIEIASE